MTNDERSPKARNPSPRVRSCCVPLDIWLSAFLRHSSFELRHYPTSPPPGPSLLQKVSLVSLQQGLRVVWQKINLTMKLLHFTRLQSAHAGVVVQTDNHALKQFLRLVP